MRIRGVLAGATVAALLLNGCGGGGGDATGVRAEAASKQVGASEATPPVDCPSPSKQVRVTLDGYMGAENLGILMAKKRGFFHDLGLHVWVGAPVTPEAPTYYVSTGADDVGVTQPPQVVLAKEKGEPVVAIGSLVSRPTAALMRLPGSGIQEVADLVGKKIAVPGISPQRDLLDGVLAEAGVTPKEVRIVAGGYDLVPKLLKGQVDAIFGGSPNMEGAALEVEGAEAVSTPSQELGIPPYEELVVIARGKCLAKYPTMYRHFMTAVARGTKAAVEDPGGSIQLIEESVEADPGASRSQTAAQVRATLPLLSRDAHMDPARAAGLIAWMDENDLVQREFPVAELFSNDYLAP